MSLVRRPSDLAAYWKQFDNAVNILPFYGHSPKYKYACFSNFFTSDTTFVVPKQVYETRPDVTSQLPHMMYRDSTPYPAE